MKTKFLAIFLLMLAARSLQAQTLKGTVTEQGTSNKLPNVFIKDENTRYVTLTDKNGEFEMRASQGHIVIFSSPGYVSDTLYVTDLIKRLRIELTPISIALRQVNIASTRSARFNPQAEYPDVYRKARVYALSPSSWLSKEGRNARRLKRYFAHEVQERHVDSIFTVAYVGSIVPLKGQELEDFMSLYRPSYAFLIDNNGQGLAAYINDSYKKFKALPPSQRKMQQLVTPQVTNTP